MTAIGIIGSAGRMGKELAIACEEAGLVLAGGIDVGGDPLALARQCDVLIDFSSPKALQANLDAAVAAQTPILIGTTGLAADHHAVIDAAAAKVAVLQTGNTSLGVSMLVHLVREAASRLGVDWDVEVVETHHRHKVDAPSGTALMLGQGAAAGRGIDLAVNSERGRDGVTGARKEGAIGFASLRGGSVIGDHMVMFATEHERLELRHVAENRALFARGAMKAAQWLAGQGAGRYSMNDMLGLG
jgi:4-hydroxy-tetrahydrodipicolinate reductase